MIIILNDNYYIIIDICLKNNKNICNGFYWNDEEWFSFLW